MSADAAHKSGVDRSVRQLPIGQVTIRCKLLASAETLRVV